MVAPFCPYRTVFSLPVLGFVIVLENFFSILKWDVFVPVLGGVAVALVLVVLVKALLLVRLANLHGKEFLPCLAGLLPNADLVFLPVHIDRATPLGSVGVCIFFAECGSAIGVVVWFVVHSVFDD